MSTDVNTTRTPAVHSLTRAATIEVSVIVPTYCEAQNLPELVPLVAKALDEANLSAEIIIVDDDSPDETPEVCERLAQDYPLRLVVRHRERGLSSAVIHGMEHARGEVLVVMDADLSHPPERVPELVAAIKEDSTDFVIGSRYVSGGKTDEDWGLFRWLNSKVATLLAWPLTSAKDPMAGFFALRAATFKAAERLDPIGYKIGLELMVKSRCQNVKEIPIRFRDRLHGTSKLTLKEQLNYLRHLARLYRFRLGAVAQPLQFALVGSSGVIVDLCCYAVLLTVLPLSAARALAIWIAMSWNFGLNRRFTFAECRRDSVIKQYVLFGLACMLGGLVNWSLSVGLSNQVPFFQDWKLLAALLGVIAGTGFNYLLSRHFVFR
ncbi:MAG: glycosyltransferase family 2 protein [Planctomycetota bacterium]|nr:glycosyltransferase family 2 protein [Planctomycetota bacterium]